MTHPTPTPEDLAKIAGRLSEAQLDALLSADFLADGRVLVDAGPVLGGSHSAWPQGVCRYYSARRDALTPFGEALRAHIMEDTRR